ncbi:MAG: Gfo/Idh/MocA family oxidoreductase [Planctomycetota bacterium]
MTGSGPSAVASRFSGPATDRRRAYSARISNAVYLGGFSYFTYKTKEHTMKRRITKNTRGRRITRRELIGGALAAAGVIAAAPAFLRGQNLNNKLNIAMIACDVNQHAVDAAARRFPKAKKYNDIRRVFDSPNDFDAVMISTTEHTHTLAAYLALTHGKHVYCEKPHGFYNGIQITERFKEEMPVPSNIDWDLWIGPAPMRPFHATYLPGPRWYRWWDLGNGTMSDRAQLFVGDEGMLYSGGRSGLQLLPEEKFKDYPTPPETLPRSPGHYIEWIQACKGEGPAPGSNFLYSGWVTESNHLGNVAYRTGKKLDGEVIEARQDAQVRAMIGDGRFALVILGGAHDLAENVRKLAGRDGEYARVTTRWGRRFGVATDFANGLSPV